MKQDTNKGGVFMTNVEVYKIIGERVTELVKNIEVQKKMFEIAKTKGKDAAEKWLYMTAIATLVGIK